jgi:hypothetical protein
MIMPCEYIFFSDFTLHQQNEPMKSTIEYWSVQYYHFINRSDQPI